MFDALKNLISRNVMDILHYQTCTLMHQDIPVANLKIDTALGKICKINEIMNPDHLPIAAQVSYNEDISSNKANKARSLKFLDAWWDHRGIPTSSSSDHLRQETGFARASDIQLLSLGLSLTDHYWVRSPKQKHILSWHDINLFENDISPRLGRLMFMSKPAIHKHLQNKGRLSDYTEPLITPGGNLRKYWEIRDGQRILVKGGSCSIEQEPFNEYIATLLAQALNIPHIPYELDRISNPDHILSRCPCMTDINTEFIPAYDLLTPYVTEWSRGSYSTFLSRSGMHGLDISYIRDMLNRMIVFDYLLLNVDRHFGNFGILRNPKTLQGISFCPIFDTGMSLCHPHELISKVQYQNNRPLYPARPFCTTQDEQLTLVNDFSWIDVSVLESFAPVIEEILKLNPKISNTDLSQTIDTPARMFQQQVDFIRQKIDLDRHNHPDKYYGCQDKLYSEPLYPSLMHQVKENDYFEDIQRYLENDDEEIVDNDLTI